MSRVVFVNKIKNTLSFDYESVKFYVKIEDVNKLIVKRGVNIFTSSNSGNQLTYYNSAMNVVGNVSLIYLMKIDQKILEYVKSYICENPELFFVIVK